MNSTTNHIKPAFAPETEFQVETLTILHSDQIAQDLAASGHLDLSMETEFVGSQRHPYSALND